MKFDSSRQNKLAQDFHTLHHLDKPLILVNAWDCTSARLVREMGYPAIATSSASAAWSVGYKDGKKIPLNVKLEVLQRICRVVDIPVSADIEDGYIRENDEDFFEFIREVIKAGVVGINLEDSNPKTGKLDSVEVQTNRIKLAKEAGRTLGVNLFVNARTDAIEKAEGDMQARIQEAIYRAKVWEEAGADGIFVPFISDIEVIAQLKKGINLPLNILMDKNLKVADLRNLKINRISTGSKPFIATMGLLKKISSDLLTGDDWSTLFTDDINYPEINNWF